MTSAPPSPRLRLLEVAVGWMLFTLLMAGAFSIMGVGASSQFPAVQLGPNESIEQLQERLQRERAEELLQQSNRSALVLCGVVLISAVAAGIGWLRRGWRHWLALGAAVGFVIQWLMAANDPYQRHDPLTWAVGVGLTSGAFLGAVTALAAWKVQRAQENSTH